MPRKEGLRAKEKSETMCRVEPLMVRAVDPCLPNKEVTLQEGLTLVLFERYYACPNCQASAPKDGSSTHIGYILPSGTPS